LGFDREGAIPYGLVTLHRPSNVDDSDRFESIVRALEATAAQVPLVFPVHPRTQAKLAELGANPRLGAAGVQTSEPISYLEFLGLERQAVVVITDSGGVQEETAFLGVPCVTLRPNTERPITITMGTNRLVPDPADLPAAVRGALSAPPVSPSIPGWDGAAGERIADVLLGARL
jgi:UDP-N-acetylglucosamine 2-epimerase (non-hydrolysing)